MSANVLRDWDKAGKITTIRSPGGIRLFDITSVVPSTVAQSKRTPDCKVLAYVRVSSADEQAELEQQEAFVLDNLPSKYASSQMLTIADTGSGLDFKRPGLLRVLELVKAGGVSGVVVASRDRLARIGFELLEWFCTQHGTALVVLGEEDSATEEELCRELRDAVSPFFKKAPVRRRRVVPEAVTEVAPEEEQPPPAVVVQEPVAPPPAPEPEPEVPQKKRAGRKPKAAAAAVVVVA